MPEKTQQLRSRQAKAKGTTMTVKASDTGAVPAGKSTHALKKSGGVVGRTRLTERSVSQRRPPGEGKTARSAKLPLPETGSSTSRRATIPDEAAAQYRKDRRRKTVPTESAAAYRREERPKRPRSEARQRQEARSALGSPVQGRKKAPSEMAVKRRGGPRKRLPLHEG
ncbi:hypothetical protein [Melittangium boletus]|uniref:Uncharacterized protein n=1 Tax=Melittangium boletus DSM 14713 TaxID=1294270 RepID=A0A250I7L1_9BACT|nr:hypothetical protein [Melittangium boletus]ATB27173.1 hypothetical protein MEBOL_000611 [Melittangium boletus DSM 14713]